MIVVVGRPGLNDDGAVHGSAGQIAAAAAAVGGRVEVVGSVGDDADGDAVITALGRAGIGHAAVLRDPAGVTPRARKAGSGRLPRLDMADLELGLRYLAECQVLVVGEPLPEDVVRVAADAAAYHGAALVVLAAAGAEQLPAELPADATVLAVPDEDGGAFAALVGRYAALLDTGQRPADAWRDAVAQGGWEPTDADSAATDAVETEPADTEAAAQ